MDVPLPGLVLLAAGRGSRLNELTQTTHKSLLDVGGAPALAWTLDASLNSGEREIVVVTGYLAEDIESFIQSRYPDRGIRLVSNPDWADDTNIRSAAIGVAALTDRSKGYVLIETDLVLEPTAWSRVFRACQSASSTWFTKGTYSRSLTGGCLQVDEQGRVSYLEYVPTYEAAFDGWAKLVGILYVSPSEVARDIENRDRAQRRSTRQYYMAPWVENLATMPCVAVDLGDAFVASFNDVRAYEEAILGLANSDGLRVTP